MPDAARRPLVFLSVPGLRPEDLERMPNLTGLVASGARRPLEASFPAVTWPVQANMLTGRRASAHGVIANGFFWRETGEVEMWTAWNDKILQPQVWDVLGNRSPRVETAVWFPMLSKGAGADYVCMPAPVHNPDGTESLWCYTKPQEFYRELLETFGHFPLQNFWGPLTSIASSRWIAQSAAVAVDRFQPGYFFIYLPHLDYAAQKIGPDSPEALNAVSELDEVIGRMAEDFARGYGDTAPVWMVASEYVITSVDHVSYPNRLLRDAGLLKLEERDGREHLDPGGSPAWALVDHQQGHVFVRDSDPRVIERVRRLMTDQPGIAEVLVGADRERYGLDHPRAGDVVLVSEPRSWQAYYWWTDDARAPEFARTVDIHRKPGYDPVEMHLDRASRSIPLDATLVRGSHGAPVRDPSQRGVVASSEAALLGEADVLRDVDLYRCVLEHFE